MDKVPFSKRVFFFTLFLSLAIISATFIKDFFYDKTRIVFCDVGQGDGAYIRTKNKLDILIDAGRDRSILSCLGRHMAFYDRTIELAFLSHPQFDHYGGFNFLIDRYNIETFVTNALDNNNKSYNLLKSKLKSHNIQIKNLYQGDNVDISSVDRIYFIWPTQNFIASNTVLGATTEDLNDFSQIFIFSEGDFDVLFTGDIDTRKFNLNAGVESGGGPKTIEILKVPHHGSKNGLTEEFLKQIDPELSIISVGKNSYGHPSSEILEIFSRLKKNYLRTDKEGDIIIEIDNKGWKILD